MAKHIQPHGTTVAGTGDWFLLPAMWLPSGRRLIKIISSDQRNILRARFHPMRLHQKWTYPCSPPMVKVSNTL